MRSSIESVDDHPRSVLGAARLAPIARQARSGRRGLTTVYQAPSIPLMKSYG